MYQRSSNSTGIILSTTSPTASLRWKDSRNDEILGVFLFVVSERFADPTKIDAAMPCFRLGAFGTERERHKRVTGLFSCVFADEAEGDQMFSAALGSLDDRSG